MEERIEPKKISARRQDFETSLQGVLREAANRNALNWSINQEDTCDHRLILSKMSKPVGAKCDR
jgi:hypothetical protein